MPDKRFINRNIKISKRPFPRTEVFYLRRNHHNVHNLHVFATDNSRSKFMLNSTVYRANQLYQTLRSEVKDCPSGQLFKNKIKTWRCN